MASPYISRRATSTPVLVVSTESSQNVFSFGNPAQAQVNCLAFDFSISVFWFVFFNRNADLSFKFLFHNVYIIGDGRSIFRE